MTDQGEIKVRLDGRVMLRHSADRPLFAVGRAESDITARRGNFTITEKVLERIDLPHCVTEIDDDATVFKFSRLGEHRLVARIEQDDGRVVVTIDRLPAGMNRLWVMLPADPGEKIYGCGEQYSHLNLRGRVFPLWTSEPGVGRNRATEITRQANAESGGGGDFWTTGFPAPTFVSSRGSFCHAECSCYMAFDFSRPDRHELCFWGPPEKIILGSAETLPALLKDLTGLLGRQPACPHWALDGIILGIQGGTEALDAKLAAARAAGVRIAGAWCQDWCGIRMTSFGKRLRWNWRWDQSLYPGLDRRIAELARDGIRFLAYINPYLCDDGEMFKEADGRGHLVRDRDGRPMVIDFGEFGGGHVDLTSPDAREWFKRIIRENLLGLGAAGWMADFGEYLPPRAAPNNLPFELAHNRWPALWAELNHDAIAGRDDVFFFMRAGFTGSQRHAVSLWAGDQSVDWSRDDGLPSVIPAALSLGLTGVGLTHSDIGGYTALFGMQRTKELFLRWLEMACFTPVMRTHEGNRPWLNHQFDTDAETLAAVARFSGLHSVLAPYISSALSDYQAVGLPAQRPLFLHYPDDAEAWDTAYEYLLGRDLLVAPVLAPGVTEWEAYLPTDRWIHFWTGREYGGGRVVVPAPVGQPPVFFRAESPFAPFIEALRQV